MAELRDPAGYVVEQHPRNPARGLKQLIHHHSCEVLPLTGRSVAVRLSHRCGRLQRDCLHTLATESGAHQAR